jgi:hypothetical protein
MLFHSRLGAADLLGHPRAMPPYRRGEAFLSTTSLLESGSESIDYRTIVLAYPQPGEIKGVCGGRRL